MKRGQISVEYLITVSFVLVMILILSASYVAYQKNYESDIVTSQVNRIGRTLTDASEEVYYYGPPSKSTIKIYMPQDVETVSIDGHSIVFRVRTPGGVSEMESFSQVNMTGNFSVSQGLKLIEINAMEGYVWITER